jgi:hypothetical protein
MATIEQAWPWKGQYTTPEEQAAIRELRYMDGLSMPRVSEITGRDRSTIQRHAPGWPGKIDNTPLRDAFLASGLEAVEVALRCGWIIEKDGGTYGDCSRVRRSLGLQQESGRSLAGKYCRYMRTRIDAENAALIAEAIGVAPWSVGCHD